MSTIDPRTPVGRLAAEQPGRSEVLERYGIDYCCGGKRPLERVCREQGIDVEALLRELTDSDVRGGAVDTFDAMRATLAELVDHIVSFHHYYLRRELPRLAAHMDKVVTVHGGHHPELIEARDVFLRLKEELRFHMVKEEEVLFPIIKQLDWATDMPEFHCGSVVRPILVMEHEHAEAGVALARLRTLTDGYTPPAGACTTYRVLLAGLAGLEADLHRHIHEENNVLFPRARAVEAMLLSRVAPEGSCRL